VGASPACPVWADGSPGRRSPQVPVGPQGFNHLAPSVANQDCAACHRNAGVNWVGGQFNHSPMPTSCNSCHAGSRPSATVAVPVPTPTLPRPNQMLHSALFQGTADCVGCHANTTANRANVGSSFAGGTFDHREVSGAQLVTVSSCKSCHELQRPTTVSASGFSHQRAGIASLDCAGCHRNSGLNWNSQTYNHSPAPASCNSCHSATRPAGPRSTSPPAWSAMKGSGPRTTMWARIA
jgi:Class III cytochrome C family